MVIPQPSHGARIALSKVHACTPCCQPWRAFSTTTTTRQKPTTANPVPRRPTAVERHSIGYVGRRNYAVSSTAKRTTFAKDRPRNIAVIGGGLTGLSTAWFLTKFMPEAKVTIYEGSGRLGGWIDTEKVEVEDINGKRGFVRFERGARTVQPKTSLQNFDDVAFYELLTDIKLDKPEGNLWLGLEASDRYFYYPDHLVRLPRFPDASDPLGRLGTVGGLVLDLFREPIYEGLVPFALNFMRRNPESPDFRDVSIGEEFLRRGGGRREPVDNMISAMCHGIYGGDVWKLSAESSIFYASFMVRRLKKRLPAADNEGWDNENGLYPLLAQDVDLLSNLRHSHMADTKSLLKQSRRIKSFNIADGYGALPDAMWAKLKKNPNVKIVMDNVAKVRLSTTGRLEVTPSKPSSRPVQYDKVISTIYSKHLASIAPHNSLPSLALSTAVTIRLVNLWSPIPNLNYNTKGFGYLLPQSVPAEKNPHAALGVIFDSDRTWDTDDLPPSVDGSERRPAVPGDTVPGTKLTVMLGGHHWDGIPPAWLPDAATDDVAAVAAAKETVEIQMGIPAEVWKVTSTKLCVDCIPQHLVGHTTRMAAADGELRKAFKGKLAVAGGSYTAQGVVGAARAARDVAWQVSGRDRREESSGKEVEWSVGDTGLKRFVGGLGRLWKAVKLKQVERFRSPGTGTE